MFLRFSLLLLAFFIVRPAEAAISCDEYTHRLEWGKLEEIIPRDATAEERCNIIPDECGSTGLIFNPPHQVTLYFKSECFMELAIKSLEEKYCDLVIERKSIFFDGSYFSPESCRQKIQTIKSDAATPKSDPARIRKIKQISPTVKDGALIVDIMLNNSEIEGEYALSVIAKYHDSSLNSDVSAALNPDGDGFRFDQSFKRFNPVSDFIIPIKKDQQSIRFTISQSSFAPVAKVIGTEEITLEVKLQFIHSYDGKIADQDSRDNYISMGSALISGH